MKIFFLFFVLLILGLGTVSAIDSEEKWVGGSLTPLQQFLSAFVTIEVDCSLEDGTVYKNYDGQCRERYNCEPAESGCGCEVKDSKKCKEVEGGEVEEIEEEVEEIEEDEPKSEIILGLTIPPEIKEIPIAIWIILGLFIFAVISNFKKKGNNNKNEI